MPKLTEPAIEALAIELFKKLGYQYLYAPSIAPDRDTPERERFEDVVLLAGLRSAVARINPTIPADAREDAVKQILRLNSPELIANNKAFHRLLTEGVKVSYQVQGQARSDLVWLIDFAHPDNNEFVVANQFTVIGHSDHGHQNKRPDVVLLVNGLPLVVIEIKNTADENVTVKAAFQQLQTYKEVIPSLLLSFEPIFPATTGDRGVRCLPHGEQRSRGRAGPMRQLALPGPALVVGPRVSWRGWNSRKRSRMENEYDPQEHDLSLVRRRRPGCREILCPDLP